MSRRRARAPLAVALAAFLLAAACAENPSAAPPTTASPTTTPTTTIPAGPDGPFAVGRHTETYVDTTRATPAAGIHAAAPSRTLVTTIWYPAEGPASAPVTDDAPPLDSAGPFPIVELSHGWTATAPEYESLGKAWASAGYVVAAPTFPASSGPGGSLLDFVEQPADVSFVLDNVLAEATEPGNLLDGLIDTERVGIAGHSLGGLTTVGAAMNTCCRDPRADAAIALAAVRIEFEGGTFGGGNPPILMAIGDADELVPMDHETALYAAAEAPKFLLTIHGGDHVDPYVPAVGGPDSRLVVDTTIAFLDFYLKDRPAGLDRMTDAVRSSGTAELMQDVAT